MVEEAMMEAREDKDMEGAVVGCDEARDEGELDDDKGTTAAADEVIAVEEEGNAGAMTRASTSEKERARDTPALSPVCMRWRMRLLCWAAAVVPSSGTMVSTGARASTSISESRRLEVLKGLQVTPSWAARMHAWQVQHSMSHISCSTRVWVVMAAGLWYRQCSDSTRRGLSMVAGVARTRCCMLAELVPSGKSVVAGEEREEGVEAA